MALTRQEIYERSKERYKTDPEYRKRKLETAKRYMDKYRAKPEVKQHRKEYQNRNAKHLTQKQKENNQSKPFRYAFMRLKLRAKQANIPFNLTEDYLEKIWTGVCAVFGTELQIPYSTDRTNPDKATVDKIDPLLGYTEGNVAWVSNRANIIKSFGTEEEHRLIADYIASHTH